MALDKHFMKGNYNEGVVRTDLDCHECKKKFVAKLNYDISGDHKIVCPYCGHLHWRTIKKGVVTGDRWGHENPTYGGFVDVATERFWRDDTLQAETTSVAVHIRERFMK